MLSVGIILPINYLTGNLGVCVCVCVSSYVHRYLYLKTDVTIAVSFHTCMCMFVMLNLHFVVAEDGFPKTTVSNIPST